METNILYGNIEILDNVPVGEMIVVLSGEKDKVEAACAAIEEMDVQITVLKEGQKA